MKEKIVQICYQKFCSIKYHNYKCLTKTKKGANEEVEVRADAVEGGANETEGGAD